MAEITITCVVGHVTKCGSVTKDDDKNITPWVCLTCYRAGWRAEGLRTRPAELKLYQLPGHPQARS